MRLCGVGVDYLLGHLLVGLGVCPRALIDVSVLVGLEVVRGHCGRCCCEISGGRGDGSVDEWRERAREEAIAYILGGGEKWRFRLLLFGGGGAKCEGVCDCQRGIVILCERISDPAMRISLRASSASDTGCPPSRTARALNICFLVLPPYSDSNSCAHILALRACSLI